MVTRPRVASAAGQPVFSHDQTRYIAMGLAREAATLFALYKVWRLMMQTSFDHLNPIDGMDGLVLVAMENDGGDTQRGAIVRAASRALRYC